MKIYDVYHGQGFKGCVRRDDDGRKEWAFPAYEAEWQGFWWPYGSIGAIEQAIDTSPSLNELTVSIFTIRRRNRAA